MACANSVVLWTTEVAAEGAGVTEAEEEQAEETAETTEGGAGRARRVVLLGLLGVGVSATRRRLVTSPSGAAAAAFRCRLVAQDLGLVRDAGGAAALLEGRIVGVWTACGEWESGKAGQEERGTRVGGEREIQKEMD